MISLRYQITELLEGHAYEDTLVECMDLQENFPPTPISEIGKDTPASAEYDAYRIEVFAKLADKIIALMETT